MPDPAGTPVSATLSLVLERSGYLKDLRDERSEEAQGRIENLEELVSAAGEYESREAEPSLGGFVDQLSLLSEADEAGGAPERQAQRQQQEEAVWPALEALAPRLASLEHQHSGLHMRLLRVAARKAANGYAEEFFPSSTARISRRASVSIRDRNNQAASGRSAAIRPTAHSTSARDNPPGAA